MVCLFVDCRWLCHYYLPVIRYWNPEMKFEVNHRAFEEEAQIVLHKSENQSQILKPYNFVHDQLFDQIIQIENGANATLLQQSLLNK